MLGKAKKSRSQQALSSGHVDSALLKRKNLVLNRLGANRQAEF